MMRSNNGLIRYYLLRKVVTTHDHSFDYEHGYELVTMKAMLRSSNKLHCIVAESEARKCAWEYINIGMFHNSHHPTAWTGQSQARAQFP